MLAVTACSGTSDGGGGDRDIVVDDINVSIGDAYEDSNEPPDQSVGEIGNDVGEDESTQQDSTSDATADSSGTDGSGGDESESHHDTSSDSEEEVFVGPTVGPVTIRLEVLDGDPSDAPVLVFDDEGNFLAEGKTDSLGEYEYEVTGSATFVLGHVQENEGPDAYRLWVVYGAKPEEEYRAFVGSYPYVEPEPVAQTRYSITPAGPAIDADYVYIANRCTSAQTFEFGGPPPYLAQLDITSECDIEDDPEVTERISSYVVAMEIPSDGPSEFVGYASVPAQPLDWYEEGEQVTLPPAQVNSWSSPLSFNVTVTPSSLPQTIGYTLREGWRTPNGYTLSAPDTPAFLRQGSLNPGGGNTVATLGAMDLGLSRQLFGSFVSANESGQTQWQAIRTDSDVDSNVQIPLSTLTQSSPTFPRAGSLGNGGYEVTWDGSVDESLFSTMYATLGGSNDLLQMELSVLSSTPDSDGVPLPDLRAGSLMDEWPSYGVLAGRTVFLAFYGFSNFPTYDDLRPTVGWLSDNLLDKWVDDVRWYAVATYRYSR
ncbi:MAG: hypothetical protein KC561_04440 [Myxococcales bacterium]|nr:hypothetical protein [Myxococcales bacterium]